MASSTAAPAALGAAEAVDALREARARTLALTAGLSDGDLERVHSPLMSPLVWDLGHIAAFEDLWLVHRFGGRPLLRDDLADVYDAFETPRARRGDLPFLGPATAQEYLEEVRARTLEVIEDRGVSELHEMVIRHEHQHNETMLQTMQLAHLAPHGALAGQPARAEDGNSAIPEPAGRDRTPDRTPRDAAPDGTPRGRTPDRTPRDGMPRDGMPRDGMPRDGTRGNDAARKHGPGNPAHSGLELIEIPAGECTIGTRARGFAYDNERPCHRTDVRDYLIGRTPITNATYLTFVEGGGYERREWWSDEGWHWKEQYDITRPGGWTADHAAEWRLGALEPLHPDRPVVHVSWFEADAFARAHGGRLPTETEWEKAATWDQETQEARPYPWGNDPADPGIQANVDLQHAGPAPVGAYPAGASPYGCLGMIGDVWEWTASEFTGYPGFVAYPYREYSEVFFGFAHKVLRGGAWATRARVCSPTFRNWDFPQRRQIFSGVRIARDA